MRHVIIRFKQYYSRGSTWFAYVFQLGIITANAKLFEDFFRQWFGIDVMQTIILGIAGYVILSTVIGLLDLKKGIWEDENDWVWNRTPSAKLLGERVERIEKAVCNDRR